MSKFKQFVTPHSHPQSLDSGSTPAAFAKREVELGSGAITCTDHGSLAAAYEVYSLGKKHGLTSIIGLEGYFRDDDCDILKGLGVPKTDTVPRGMDRERWAAEHPTGSFYDYLKYLHVTLHAIDYDGYLCMVRLLSRADARAEQHGSERKPLFSWADLEELAAHKVTATSSCLVGMVQRHLVDQENQDAAQAYFQRMKHLFGDRFYVEVFPHVCSHNWVNKVFVDVVDQDGNEERLRFYAGKKLRTSANEEGGVTAEDLAARYDPAQHKELLEVMNYRRWTPFEKRYTIKNVTKIQDYVQNECTAMAPNGDIQWGTNRYVMELAEKYQVPVLIADDSHFAHPEEKAVQDARLAQLGDWKFWGCFEAKTPVDMADGTSKPISQIKPGDMVLTYDFTNARVVSAPVTAVMPTPATQESFVCHEFLSRGGRGQRRAVVSTPNHSFWSENGWCEISRCESRIGARAPRPNRALQEVLDGVLLGDASISIAGRRSDVAYFTYGYAESQQDLTAIVAGYLGTNTRTQIRTAPQQPFTVTNSAHPSFRSQHTRWYSNQGRKAVPRDLKLTPRMLAWWYMDDGSVCIGRPRPAAAGGIRSNTVQARLYTNCFSKDDVDFLLSELLKLGIKGYKYEYGQGWFIAISRRGWERLSQVVGPYVPPPLRYKLAPSAPDYVPDTTPGFDGETVYCIAQKRQRALPTGKPTIDTSWKYDIEVAGHHCFFVDGLLVHNSYHRQSSDEAWAYFRDHQHVAEATFEGWVQNTLDWASRFKDFKFDAAPKLPTNFYPRDTLANTKRLVTEHGRVLKRPEYMARLKAELDLLHRNGTIDLLPYFFLGEEACSFFERQGWITGPGRGSAAGLLLAYLLGITHVDPLKYGLSMERFLTVDRIRSGKLPDIDQDLPFRDPLVGWATDVLEFEAEDGTTHVVPETLVVRTNKGPMTVREALASGAELEPWWLERKAIED